MVINFLIQYLWLTINGKIIKAASWLTNKKILLLQQESVVDAETWSDKRKLGSVLKADNFSLNQVKIQTKPKLCSK